MDIKLQDIKFTFLLFSGLLLFLAFNRCNKPVLFDGDKGADSVSIHLPQKKVLLINIQGALGSAVKSADIPNIISLLPHSVYSWDAVCDTVSTDQAGWASLFTGVHVAKSGIYTNNYLDNHFDTYPSFLTRLKENDDQLHIVNVNSSPSLNDTLLNNSNADVSITPDNDEAVRDSAVRRLKNGNPDVLVATFSSVNRAGQNHGFSDTSSVYEQAIHTVDGYIGEMLKALKSRKNYGNENWLVVITSNHGGTANGSYGGGSASERNTFVLYYNPQLISKEVKRPFINVPYDGTYPYFYGYSGNNHIAYSDNAVYNFGASQSYTIEFNIRTNTSVSTPLNYAVIMSNKNYATGSNQGWVIFLFNGNVCVNFKGADAGRVDLNNGPNIVDNKWHHITVVFNREGPISIYIDGKFYVQGGNIKGDGNIDANLHPLVIGADGRLQLTPCFCYLADIRVWNTVLSPETIKEWAFQPLAKSHPDYNSLIGYWSCTDGANATMLKDYSPQKSNLTIENGLRWDKIDGILNPSNIDPLQFVPKSVDGAINILAWMGVKIQPSWNLDGQVWVLE